MPFPNEKQIGIAAMMYSQDYDEGLPAWDEYFSAVTIPLPNPWPGDAPWHYWTAKLAPYVKSGNPDDPTATNNGGMWHCPDAGDKGEQVYFLDSKGNPTTRYAFSYGYNGMLAYTNYGWLTFKSAPFDNLGTKLYYRYPVISQIDQPAGTVFVGDGGGYAGRIAPPFSFNCYGKRVTGYTSECWEIPDRHNNGANYVFCDGHAKYLQSSLIYPKPANPVKPTTAEKKAGYAATGNYFAYSDQERQDWLQFAQ